MLKRKKRVTNGNDRIEPTDYYVAHGLEALLLGARYYSEAETHYSRLDQDQIIELSQYIPLITDIRWSGLLMPLLDHSGPLAEALQGTKIEREASLNWLHRQRSDFKKQELRSDRIEVLDQRLPRWRDGVEVGAPSVDPVEVWNEKFEWFVDFYSSNGRPPRQKETEPEVKSLYAWYARQRKLHLKGKLPQERRERLDEMTPGWFATPDGIWQSNADAVATYKSSHGKFPSPTSKDKNLSALGAWIKAQRRAWRKGELDEEKSRTLSRLMPGWEVVESESERRHAEDQIWLGRLADFRNFLDARGRVPSSAITAEESERQLGVWFDNQRLWHRRNILKADRAAMLDSSVPGWMTMTRPAVRLQDLRDTDGDAYRIRRWKENLGIVVGFIDSNGTCPSSTSHDVEEKTSGLWIARQREYLRENKLTDEMVLALDNALPWWKEGKRGIDWHLKLKAVKSYHSRFDFMPQGKEGEHEALTQWLSNQRAALKKGTLRSDKTKSLDDSLPGWEQAMKSTTGTNS